MIDVGKENFQREVLEANGYVIVDYWCEGCRPCMALMPDIEALAVKYEGEIKFTKLNTAKARRVAIVQKILGLPAVALYKDGEKTDEVIKEEATKENIENMIKKIL
ncbi:MAG: thioredoxin domain-containing protein [Marinisporobacter sp.]|jgi:thioredoxin 1|nr:thioredoxin domain-containing protein [Marinisporobacter sp.]